MDSDPEVVLVDKVDEDELSIDKDSGMESAGNSKDDTPERKQATLEDLPQVELPKPASGSNAATKPQTSAKPTSAVSKSKDDDYDDEPDETLAERLWGLTEMFPQPVRTISGAVTDLSVASVKTLYKLTCNASWIFFTSSMILFAPVVFEVERAQMEEMQKTQQKQVLLGPGSAVGAGPGGMPSMPPMAAR
ncbi:mitochondrial import receptor subunit TOM22 homolog [Malaya genurostris]|uniref:mitochondrial import receptor subunit TOM22 homolog n=1 Tax=Malaya genurostris TaxID=325434 RepID=UPI0026F3C0B4|nr:mitochondrial import receptor subunit TOM22 homolog [Malaya genurostris]XP_058463104.1 mitochondrial import receptor subunit TOM22 homolog [Malaya genurostris]